MKKDLLYIIFHQKNACLHTKVVAIWKLNELKYNLLHHPPYSYDLAPFNIYLFPPLKIFYDWKWFYMKIERKLTLADNNFGELEESHFRDGTIDLEHRWMKYLEHQTDYIKKIKTIKKNSHFPFYFEYFSNHTHKFYAYALTFIVFESIVSE